MRIAIFTEAYHPFISGVVTHVQTLKEGLEAAGHKVLVVSMDPKARHHYIKDNVLHCPAISVKKLYGNGVGNPMNLTRLRIIENFNPDIIHMHTEFTMGLFAMFTAKRLKKPSVYTLHTMYDDYIFYLFPERLKASAKENMNKVAKPMAHFYIRKVATNATEVIGPSVKVVNYLRRCGVSRHINIVPNTVDLTAFMPESVNPVHVAEVSKQLGIRQGDVALCFVGRLGREKSIDVLIDYFSDAFAGDERFKLFIIGDGPEKEELKAQIEQRGVEAQVKLLGRIEHDDIPYYFHAFSLFSTASLTEMNSISLLEATASGLYAVHRLDLYNRDQIKTGENGEVFETAEEFADIVRRYAALSTEERAQKRKSVTVYAKRYGRKEFTEAILNVYARAIDEYKKK